MTDYSLNPQQTFNATPERLWLAWTTEAGLAAWWWNGWPTTTYTVDLRVGGSYRITSEPQRIGVHGQYLEIVPLQRLVSSWSRVTGGVDCDFTERIEGSSCRSMAEPGWSCCTPDRGPAEGRPTTICRAGSTCSGSLEKLLAAPRVP